MEKFDALYTVTLSSLIEELNRCKIARKDVVTIFQDRVTNKYVAIFYK